MASLRLETLQGRLQRFARAHYGGEAIVRQPQVMPGHAGLSFGFTIAHQKEGRPCQDSLSVAALFGRAKEMLLFP